MAARPASDLLEGRAAIPRADLAYRPFLVAALLFASLVGFVLGLHVALGRLLDMGRPERTADLIQAHGQAQLLGFAGLYVMAMSLRLLPRFTGGVLQESGLLPVILWPLTAALVLRSAVVPLSSGELHYGLMLASQFGVLLATGAFLLLTSSTLTYGARRPDAAGTAFLLASLLLFAAAVVGMLAVIDEGAGGSRSLPYLTDTAVTQLELLGFVLVAIAGVALRALPVLVGRRRPERAAGLLPAAVAVAIAVHAAALLYLQYGAYTTVVAMLADASLALLGAVLLVFVWQAGVLRPHANRARPASQASLWLVRGAFAWLPIAALLMLYYGLSAVGSRQLLQQTNFDAIRHAVGVGVITNLIAGMSLLILPEFAGERLHSNRQRWLAIGLALLINVAAILRVVPSIAADAWSEDRRDLSMSIAGAVAEVAMIVFAVYLLRLIARDRPATVA
jgi:hypothetical protein